MSIFMQADRIVFARVALLRTQLEALKRRAGVSATKDLFQVAVDLPFHCAASHERDWWWASAGGSRV